MKEKGLDCSKEQNPHLTLMLLHYYNESSYYEKESYYTILTDYQYDTKRIVCSK
jgi:hypothetical protein